MIDPVTDFGPHPADRPSPRERIKGEVRAALASDTAHRQASAPKASLPTGVWSGTFAELDALDIPDPRILFYVAGISIAEQETVLVRGHANVFKSFLAMVTLAVAAMAEHRVLLLAGEGSKGATRKRLRRILAALSATPDVYERIHVVQGPFHLVEHAPAWDALLERTKPSLVVIDPLVEYNGGDENSAQEMIAFTAHVSRAKAVGAAVLVIHHSTKPDKDGKTSARGSGALRGWTDHEIEVTQTVAPNTVLLDHQKNRERAKEQVRSVDWQFTDEAISMAVRFEDAQKAESDRLQRATTILLGRLAQGDLTVTAARGKMSGATFAAFVGDLERAGRLHRFVGMSADKKGREREAQMLRLGPNPSRDNDLSGNTLSGNPEEDE